MDQRNNELPEGTDQIIEGASSTAPPGRDEAFIARADATPRSDLPARSTASDKLASQVRDQVTSLRGQATDRLRGLADDGKGRATTLLDDIASVIDDAAKSIDERMGREYGDYAHRASDAVTGFAGRVREKSVDDLVGDTRSLVRSSPAVAIAAAAVAGFAIMRIVKSGLGQNKSQSADSDSTGTGKSGKA